MHPRPSALGRLLLPLALALAVLPTATVEAQERSDLHPLIAFAIEHANELYPSADGPAFAHEGAAPFVVLARLDLFADSLAASVLLDDQPLLYTDGQTVEPAVADELARLMPGGGIVYVLGGPAAIDEAVLDALTAEGHDPRRLAGPTRVETALAIADLAVEINGQRGRVAIARADGPEPTAEWADAIAAAPWAATFSFPVLLTPTDTLHPAVEAWIADNGVEETVILGGEAAVSAEVEAALPSPTRYEGPNRFATAVTISTDLFRFSSYNFRIIAADHPDGWGYALAGTGMAVEDRAPVLLVNGDSVPTETADRTCSGGRRAGIEVLGPLETVGQDVRDELASDCP